MKTKNILYFVSAFLLSLTIVSCSDKNDEGVDPIVGGDGIVPISLKIDKLSIGSNLACKLYLFRKSSTDTDYNYWRIVDLRADNTDTLKFKDQDWLNTDYKFLFTCTTAANPEIAVGNSSNTQLTTANTWSEVRISRNVSELTKDSYYAVIDKTGYELLRQTLLQATLSRMVGQMVFDIYRTDTDINSPTSIVSADVASVLDRVYQIDIEYSNMVNELSFTNANEIQKSQVATTPVLQQIVTDLDTDLKLSLPQPDNKLNLYKDSIRGAVRIEGLIGLPAESDVTVKLTFYYYDDTPACGDPSHSHSVQSGCFTEKKLELNIPQNNPTMQYLKFVPNTYTVNKAGIQLDRIIDLKVPASFGFNTEWTNQE